jgi:hypothetical protein
LRLRISGSPDGAAWADFDSRAFERLSPLDLRPVIGTVIPDGISAM